MVCPDTDSAVQTMPAMAITKNIPVVPDNPNCSSTADEMMMVSMVMPDTGLRAVVAMAKSSAEPPGTSGSQFYVVTGADAGLPPEYALLGEVSSGLDVVERIGELETVGEKPKQTVLIEEMTIEKG